MLCQFCKEEISDDAIKCKHCKSLVNEQGGDKQTGLSSEIREELKKYQELIQLLCLECGYEGQMGVLKKVTPWYLTWWVLVPVFLTGIGTIPAILMGIWSSMATRHRVVCPSCKVELLQK